MKLKFSVYAIIVLLSITGCQQETVYHRYQPTGENGWLMHDSLFYTLPSQVLPGTFKLNIGVRHTELYPYKDIWIEIGSKGNTTQKDTFHLHLTDKEGHWHNSTTARLYQCDVDKGTLHLSSQDTLLYMIHLMNDSLLTGIHDVGIRLSLPSRINTEKHEEQNGKSPQ